MCAQTRFTVGIIIAFVREWDGTTFKRDYCVKALTSL